MTPTFSGGSPNPRHPRPPPVHPRLVGLPCGGGVFGGGGGWCASPPSPPPTARGGGVFAPMDGLGLLSFEGGKNPQTPPPPPPPPQNPPPAAAPAAPGC